MQAPKEALELEDMIMSDAANQDSTTTAAGSEVSQHSSGRESHVKKQARLESEWQSHTSHPMHCRISVLYVFELRKDMIIAIITDTSGSELAGSRSQLMSPPPLSATGDEDTDLGLFVHMFRAF